MQAKAAALGLNHSTTRHLGVAPEHQLAKVQPHVPWHDDESPHMAVEAGGLADQMFNSRYGLCFQIELTARQGTNSLLQ